MQGDRRGGFERQATEVVTGAVVTEEAAAVETEEVAAGGGDRRWRWWRKKIIYLKVYQNLTINIIEFNKLSN